MKKISVIVPCYNAIKYIEECLKSIEKQTIGMDNLEVILVNDASTDNTLNHLVRFRDKHPGSTIVIDLKKNSRQGGARNRGLEKVSGKYIAFLDSDDIALPQAYETLYKCAEENMADIVQFNHYNFQGDSKELCDNCKLEGKIIVNDIETRKLFLMADVLTMNHCSKLYSTDLIKKAGVKFAENCIFEEPLFVYPLMFYANHICCIKNPLYKIRIHEKSTMHKDVKTDNRLMDHPKVQLQLLHYMLNKTEYMKMYAEEIEFYFLKTYYIETLFFSAQGKLGLNVEDYRKMQFRIKDIFPDYKMNKYVNEDRNIVEIINTIEQECDSDEQVSEICEKVYAMLLY